MRTNGADARFDRARLGRRLAQTFDAMTTILPSPPNFLSRVFELPAGDVLAHSVYVDDDKPRICSLHTLEPNRPYVTLTFAQSLDAKIAGQGGKQLALSGNESMLMTHWLRTFHDGILVGIGTALNDNPQLNTRHLPPFSADGPYKYHLPRPIILDTDLRLPIDCKLLRNYRAGVGRRPWVVTRAIVADGDESHVSRQTSLETTGARIIEVNTDGDGRISIPSLLVRLRELGIQSLMVEGGARVIQSFLGVEARHRNCIDTVIITVAPTLVGNGGVGYGTDLSSDMLPGVQHIETELFGRDAVVAFKVTQ
ncbi:hypothetical protein DAEQUDRAFT_722532 [Daedalea quercina L-15889]|uniref:2,5-diamino-6-ribosylamino-4(3H)-pyrimidinone 5'-phosphate reductase n=1 Tax=Daedalea quercina L-15889 TaxID=1314783 RepID=A0A165T429_9APHY|nr:hypothetical protein DAEQUDRAFT_722532 [Daedalea quercina L-15889]